MRRLTGLCPEPAFPGRDREPSPPLRSAGRPSPSGAPRVTGAGGAGANQLLPLFRSPGAIPGCWACLRLLHRSIKSSGSVRSQLLLIKLQLK